MATVVFQNLACLAAQWVYFCSMFLKHIRYFEFCMLLFLQHTYACGWKSFMKHERILFSEHILEGNGSL